MFGNYTISNECPAPNHVCEVEEYGPFTGTSPFAYQRVVAPVVSGAAICFLAILFHWVNIHATGITRPYMYYAISSLIVLFFYMIWQPDYETCSFMRWCHEGIDDQIIPTVYFYQMNECPKSSSSLTYYDYSDMEQNDQCIYTEFGCCEIWGESQLCDASYQNGDSYSFYMMVMKRYDSHWVLPVEKSDEEGSNCPTIEELIYKVQKDDMNQRPFYISFTIIVVSIMFINLLYEIMFRKTEYKAPSESDAEKGAEKGAIKALV